MKKRLLQSLGLGLMLFFGTSAQAQCLNVNGNFETFTGPIVTSPNTASNAWINDDMNNWFVSHGSPTTGTSPTTNMWMWSYNGRGEGVYTNFTFVAGQTYELCYDLWRDATSNPTSEFRVELSNGLSPYYSTSSAYPTVSGNQSLTTQPWVSTGSWVTITETFTASNNYSQLWLHPFLAGSPSPWQAACRIDNVCIKAVPTDPCDFEPRFTVSYEEECVVTLTNTTSVPAGFTILNTTWTFGDGTSGSGSTVNHYYVTGGVYEVCMTVWMINEDGECCKKTVCERIDAPGCDPCEWMERAEITVSGTNPFTFSVAGLPSGMYDILGYHWTFGDGGTATGHTVTHAYGAAGGYEVCVTIYYYDPEREECCSVTICIGIEVREGVDVIGAGREKKSDLESGINYENEAAETFSTVILSPNPNNGAFDIRMDNNDVINSIKVYDQTGKVVYNGTNTNKTGQFSVDLTHLEKGIYTVIVNEQDAVNRRTNKLVIQ